LETTASSPAMACHRMDPCGSREVDTRSAASPSWVEQHGPLVLRVASGRTL
jgi:hypothetical protein